MRLIAYDIADRKRLSKVARYLEKHGLRVQNSTFEFDLTAREINKIKEGLEEIIDAEEDKVFIYHISSKKKKSKRGGKRKNIWEMIF